MTLPPDRTTLLLLLIFYFVVFIPILGLLFEGLWFLLTYRPRRTPPRHRAER